MDWSLYEDEAGRFKPKKLSITKGPIKVKDETDLQDMQEDLKGLPMEKAKQHFLKFFNDEYTHDLEVEQVESAFNRAPKVVLGELYCFKGHFSDLEELLDLQPDIESIPLSLSEAQTHQALKSRLIKRWTPSSQEDWESWLFHGFKVTELKLLMQENELEPKGRKAELAKKLAALALRHPEKMPPVHEFLADDQLLPELKKVVSTMVASLSENMQGHPYYYQYSTWQELMREWPAFEWPWLAEIVKGNGGTPAIAAIKEAAKPKTASSNISYDADEWTEYSQSTASLEVKGPPQPTVTVSVTSKPSPIKPATTKGGSNWATNDFEQPIEVLLKYKGERDPSPKERHVQIERVFTKGGRVFLKGMCLKSMGMKMFMVDRIKDEIVSPATGEMLNPREFTRVDDLRQALLLVGIRPEKKLLIPPTIEETQEAAAKTSTEGLIKPEGVKKPGMIRRLLAKLGG